MRALNRIKRRMATPTSHVPSSAVNYPTTSLESLAFTSMVEVGLFPQQLSERLPNRTSRYDDHQTYGGFKGYRDSCRAVEFENVSETAPRSRPTRATNRKIDNHEADTVPDGWKKYSNPAEGRVYFRNSALHLVTEAFIQHAIILERINYWYNLIIPYLDALEQTFDIFLDVMETMGEAMGLCSYYVVDYAAQSVFWLRDISTSDLGLPDVRSTVHLKHLLSEQFWIHCEYMPRDDKGSISSATELLASLGTLALDASTSTGSVSPFHPDECESYSRALKQVIETKVMIDINWCTARIMSLLGEIQVSERWMNVQAFWVIAQSRTINLHGEPGARTDRAMVVSGQYPPRHTRAFELFSKALFGIPTLYLNRWNGIWVDRIAYTREWRRVIQEITQEWLYAVIYAGILIIANVGLLGMASSTMEQGQGPGRGTLPLVAQHVALQPAQETKLWETKL
ncbi:hypothetical protein BDV93DRAFT_611647 [Ceratobasidium sp. AG-I]|nr:hypothetical protein BDV93DRAFT_611647 [Ceratobasidium sp. AG-I]